MKTTFTSTNHHDHTNTRPFPAPETVEPQAGTPKRGRPSGYAPKVIEMICVPIREQGLSDSAAAKSVGMSSSSLSRWKHDHPEVRGKLDQAREECRKKTIDRIERIADGNGSQAFKAAIWLAERLFPGDYARTISERRDWRSMEAHREENEERDVGNAIWAERLAEQDAERKAKQAAEAEAAKQAAASVSDSHNVKNSDESASPGAVERPEQATRYSEDDSRNVKNAGETVTRPLPEDVCTPSVADSHNVKNPSETGWGPLMEAVFGPSVSDSHNVKNPEAAEPSAERVRAFPAVAPHSVSASPARMSPQASV